MDKMMAMGNSKCESADITAAATAAVATLGDHEWEYFGFRDEDLYEEAYSVLLALATPCAAFGDGECPWWPFCSTR